MENMVNVYFYGKRYVVPAELTIMTAMEYAGYTPIPGAAATSRAEPFRAPGRSAGTFIKT